MPILTTKPEQVTDANIPYDRLGIHLSIGPIWDETDVRGSMALRCVPYRVRSDGTVERREDLARGMSVSDIFEEAAQDPAFGLAFSTIFGAIQQYINDAGI